MKSCFGSLQRNIDRLSHLYIVIVIWFDKCTYEWRRSEDALKVEKAMVSTVLNLPCPIVLTLGRKWKVKIVKIIGYEEAKKTTTLVRWNSNKYCAILECTKVIFLSKCKSGKLEIKQDMVIESVSQ